jgi:hypothetical protein
MTLYPQKTAPQGACYGSLGRKEAKEASYFFLEAFLVVFFLAAFLVVFFAFLVAIFFLQC